MAHPRLHGRPWAALAAMRQVSLIESEKRTRGCLRITQWRRFPREHWGWDGPPRAKNIESRFTRYVEGLVSVIGHVRLLPAVRGRVGPDAGVGAISVAVGAWRGGAPISAPFAAPPAGPTSLFRPAGRPTAASPASCSSEPGTGLRPPISSG